jgi:predicted Zn-dependent peptidase
LWSQFTEQDLQQLAANLEKEGRDTLTHMTGLLLLRDRAQSLFGMRQQAVAQVVLRSESFVARALERSDYLQTLGDPATYEMVLSDVITLAPKDIATFAERYLKGDRSRVLYLDPIPAGQRPTPGTVGVAGAAELAGALGDDTPVLGADLGDAPRVPPPPEIAEARHYHMPNGLEVAIIPRHQFPVVTAVLSFNGGTAAGEPRGVVDLLRIVQSPTLSLAANAMEVNAYDGIDFTSDVVRAGKRNLGNALLLLAARVTRVDGIDWDKALAPPEKQSAPVEPAPQVKATRAFWQALYGDHPYGRSSSYADWLAITPDQMRGWIMRMHNPRNAVLIIAGDVDVAATQTLVERWFGPWEMRREAVELRPPTPPAAPPAGQVHETVLVQHRPGVSQTEILLGCRLPAGDQRDLAKYQLLASLLGSQLQTRLREEAGAAYSIDANAAVLRGGSAHLLVTALVDDSRLGAVLKVVRGLWRHLGDSGFDRGSLSQIKWRTATGSNLGFQTSTEFALRTLDALNRGAATDFAVRMERQYVDTAPADLHAAFQVCRATTVMSLVGDEAKIRAAK